MKFHKYIAVFLFVASILPFSALAESKDEASSR
jgi:hypothetical protein